MPENYKISFAITPITSANSSNQFARTTSAIYIGGGVSGKGSIKVGTIGINGLANTSIFTSLNVGQIYPIKANYVLSANTTATNLIGLI